MKLRSALNAACAVSLIGCSAGAPTNQNPTPNQNNPNPSAPTTPGTTSGTVSAAVKAAYPVGLALASPLEVTKSSFTATAQKGLGAGVGQSRQGLSSGWASRYEIATAKINSILSGVTADKNAFEPELLFSQPGRARCFGPSVKYQNHPDFVMGMPAATGEFPGGDLGIWTETEAPSGEACAAAQINLLMAGARDQSLGALMGLAALISVANDSGSALPAAGATLDLKSQMNALGVANVTFSQADLSQLASAGAWQYTLKFDYTRNLKLKNVVVELSHAAMSDGTYNGTLYYRISGEATDFMGGNCPGSSRTINGSLRYSKASDSDMQLQSRSATFCGANIDGRVSDSSDVSYGQIDANKRYPSSSTGWSDNFNLFAANYNPDANSGNFVFAWQAGVNDSHTRVFQAGVNAHEPADGEAYFGYGNPMHTFDGNVLGMICNWAGPSGSHTPKAFVQRQAIAFDEAKGIFAQPTGGSDIVYAPTNSCDAAAGTSFNYDKNADGVVDSSDGVSAGVSADLMSQDSASSIAEAIANRGFPAPSAIGGWPSE